MSPREAARAWAVRTVPTWAAEWVTVTGEVSDEVMVRDLGSSFTSWVSIVQEPMPEALTVGDLRTVIVEHMVAIGAMWDGYAKRVRGVRI